MKKIKKIDFLIVGAGFFGAVLAERIANVLGKNVLILDKRNHIGGNCYSELDKTTGIEYHKYGTHIFHTKKEDVWSYINDFTKFNNYNHQVISSHKNSIFQMPINLETINSYFKKNFKPNEAEKFIEDITKKYKKKDIKNFEDKAVSQIGSKLYKAFIKNYTIKQWGKHPKYLPSNIFNRIPIRFNYNEDYYKDSQWQGIPLNGYTEIFNNMLDNKKIKIKLKTNYYIENEYDVKYLTIYTGPLDRLFDFKYGKLEWRSLRFEKKIINLKDYQGSSVINYPDLKDKFTRIHEPKHLHPEREVFKNNKTSIIKEFPTVNHDEPYYPVNSSENIILHKKYKQLAKKIKKFDFGGRLANYAYYDMDMTILSAIKKFNKIKINFK